MKRLKYILNGEFLKQIKYFFLLNKEKKKDFKFLFNSNKLKSFLFIIKNYSHFRRKKIENAIDLVSRLTEKACLVISGLDGDEGNDGYLKFIACLY